MQVIICEDVALFLTCALQCGTSMGSLGIQPFRVPNRVTERWTNSCHAIKQQSQHW